MRFRRSQPAGPGLIRRRRGRGWQFLDADGAAVDRATVARITGLVIPPAWQQVWISPWPNGHIQAIGTDIAGRKQYLYHQDWSTRRHAVKFERVVGFGASLPVARELVAEHLAERRFSRERALAMAFRLLDRGHFRIGGEVYAETNGSFGLATLTREHVRIHRGELVFDYTAKSGLHRIERIDDPDLVAVVRGLLRQTADVEELLAYRVGRTWHRVTGAEVNLYLKEVTGETISAKDFRTWHGTTMAAVALTRSPAVLGSRTAVAKAERAAVVAVAQQLGNTPTVCKGSYIDPRVVDAFERGRRITAAVMRAEKTMRDRLPEIVDDESSGAALTMVAATPTVEKAVLKLLRSR